MSGSGHGGEEGVGNERERREMGEERLVTGWKEGGVNGDRKME